MKKIVSITLTGLRITTRISTNRDKRDIERFRSENSESQNNKGNKIESSIDFQGLERQRESDTPILRLIICLFYLDNSVTATQRLTRRSRKECDGTWLVMRVKYGNPLRTHAEDGRPKRLGKKTRKHK